MKKDKYFADNYLGPVALAAFSIVSLILLFFSTAGLGDAAPGQTISNIAHRFFFVLLGLGVLITARTGSVNFSAAPIGYVLAGILFILNFSLLAGLIVFCIILVLGILFALVNTKGKMPLLLFAPMVHYVCRGIVLILTQGQSIRSENTLINFLSKGAIFNINFSLILPWLVCVMVLLLFVFSPLKTSIKEQRQGKKIPFAWVVSAQIICLALGLLYALILSSRVSSFYPSFSDYDHHSDLLILFAFCFCSQKLDNTIWPILMVIAGAFFTQNFVASLYLFGFNPVWQSLIMLLLAVGAMFLNRVYRVKGWYPMSLLNWMALGGLPALGVGIYQRARGFGWGEWQDL